MPSRSLLLLGAVWSLSACTLSREQYSAQPVQHGMTTAELRAAYGDPVEIDRHPNGTQDWYYRFSQQTSSRARTAIETAPLHLSPTGRVIRAIPPGRILISSPGRNR